MNSMFDCGCMTWLGVLYQKIEDMNNEVDQIMIQNAGGTRENHHNVQTVAENDKKLLAVAMRTVPLFEDNIKEAKLFDSSTRTHAYSLENAKKLLEENKQLRKQYGNMIRDSKRINKSNGSSSQKAQDDSKDSAVQYAEDMDWEVIKDFETVVLEF